MAELEVKTREELLEDIKGYTNEINRLVESYEDNPIRTGYRIQTCAGYIKETAAVLTLS